EQLNPPDGIQVIVASVFLKNHNTGDSIQQLIQRISQKIGDDVDLIDKVHSIVLTTLGNSLEYAISVKFDYNIAQQSLCFFKHQDIPKIEKMNIPPDVTE